jgi:hypothetical protein
MKENIIKGIMTEILETKDKKSAFEVFLEGENINLGLLAGGGKLEQIRNEAYTKYVNAKIEYRSIVENPEHIKMFNRMKELETLIVQSRSLIGTTIKLSMINQKRGGSETSYIIARAPFFNPENVKAEIRVYLGKTEEIGRSIEELSNDSKFMEEAEIQIVNAMKEVMEKSRVEVAIKKSVSNKVVVSLSDEDNEEDEVGSATQKTKMKSPFQVGRGINPKPKSIGFIIPKKK